MTIARLLLCGLLAWAASASGAELEDSPCYRCHKAQRKDFAEGTVHSPVAEGDCRSCHKDHGSDNRLVLQDKTPKLCFGCHDEVPAGAHLHSPVADGECGACHLPHNAPRSKLLAKPAPELCYDCHDGPGEKKSVHAPVADGECLECHAGHASAQEGLLTKGYNRERYVDFSEKAYELCFGCHEASSFSESSQESTGFRDGSRNLHYLHSVGKLEAGKYRIEKNRKRISCSGCHLVHAADQEKLIRGSQQRGAMTLYTIRFTRTEDGGTCVVGCHKPQEYHRKPVSELSRAVAGPGTPSPDATASTRSVKAVN